MAISAAMNIRPASVCARPSSAPTSSAPACVSCAADRDDLQRRLEQVHPALRPEHARQALGRRQLVEVGLHLLHRPQGGDLDDVAENRADQQRAENHAHRRQQRHEQRARHAHRPAIGEMEGLRMVEDAHQRIGDHPHHRTRGRDDAGRRHQQEPGRHVLALDDVALLARVFEALLCRLFRLLAVVLFLGHGAPLTRREEARFALHLA
jgi:hypothetical protein